MAKKIRFALEMKDNVQVRDMNGLREHFSLVQALTYAENGKLSTWLKDRYIDDVASAVDALDKADEDYASKLCKALGVDYTADSSVSMVNIQRHNEKLRKLKTVTEETRFLDVADQVVFDQDDLCSLLDDGQTTIYLCGKAFTIPLFKHGITYIGVNQPTVKSDNEEDIDWEKDGIQFIDVLLDESLKKPVPYKDDPVAMELAGLIEKIKKMIDCGDFNSVFDLENLCSLAHYTMDFVDDKVVYGDLIEDIIRICKSFYEYDPSQRSIMTDSLYDKLIAQWKRSGVIEPATIVPAGAPNKINVPIKYPTLHNNMDKSYWFYEYQQIAEGVKETESIEGFIAKVQAKIGGNRDTKIKYSISPKIDGVSINATMVGNKIMDPQTRGDDVSSIAVVGLNGFELCSTESNDKTFSVRFEAFATAAVAFTGKALCSAESNDKTFGIQFEVFVTDEDRINASEYLGLDKPYVSRRSAASGIIHRLCMGEDEKLASFLKFYPIATEGLEGSYIERMSYIQRFAKVPSDMIETIYEDTEAWCIAHQLGNLADYISDSNSAKSRVNLSYAMDGLVLTLTDDDTQREVGREGHTNKFQIGYKFDPETAFATASGITLDRGCKGFRTIQVELESPVLLDDVCCTHVPVLSKELFDKLELHEKSPVTIHRVGDVIPSITKRYLTKQVVKTVGFHISMVDEIVPHTGKMLKVPTHCPDCGKELIIKAKKLYCANDMCPGNLD